MAYVHLANGDVRKMTEKQLAAARDEAGNQTHLRDNGIEHHIIGVYPEETPYERELSEEEKSARTAAEVKERAEYEEWRASQKGFEGSPL